MLPKSFALAIRHHPQAIHSIVQQAHLATDRETSAPVEHRATESRSANSAEPKAPQKYSRIWIQLPRAPRTGAHLHPHAS